MTQVSFTAPIDPATLAALSTDVYSIGDVVAPGVQLVDSAPYADYVPRAFLPAALKLKRAHIGESDVVQVQVKLDGVAILTTPVTLSGAVTTVLAAAMTETVRTNGLPVDARVDLELIVTGEGYSSPSAGLRVDFLGRWL